MRPGDNDGADADGRETGHGTRDHSEHEETERDDTERDTMLRRLADRLDKPLGVLGVLFLLLVIGQFVTTHPPTAAVLGAASWALWVVFVAEFSLRAWLGRHHPGRFWRRNWWQLLFLAVPVLRFARVALALRTARAGAAITAAVRGSRSAGRLLTDRLAWLFAVTVSLILAAGQLLVVSGSYPSYAQALHDVTLTTITGQRMAARDPFAQGLELILAAYSVVVFGTLAGALGAYFLSNRTTPGDDRGGDSNRDQAAT
ncbi:hypothetical protein O7543_01445 [Solwaraspora sp. WMMA2080]|uniref:hypothetical protein n=1 Tax=unclassified Solwaraspora TaxID=2627926 RepID=UPI00248CA356|nr:MULTISPECIES: hypothetical protein [unclassified Solwaraspora]WBB94923.1 hypothetical protein O7553_15930 [Solwaraspora sp. WMMA2059]WBC21194.1 hypothetical protein O7543_01445 [Solwaraspora sp. WMMA2080]